MIYAQVPMRSLVYRIQSWDCNCEIYWNGEAVLALHKDWLSNCANTLQYDGLEIISVEAVTVLVGPKRGGRKLALETKSVVWVNFAVCFEEALPRVGTWSVRSTSFPGVGIAMDVIGQESWFSTTNSILSIFSIPSTIPIRQRATFCNDRQYTVYVVKHQTVHI